MPNEIFEIHSSTAGADFKKIVNLFYGALTVLIAGSYICLGIMFDIYVTFIKGYLGSVRRESIEYDKVCFGLSCVWVNMQVYAAWSVLIGMKQRKPALLTPFLAVNLMSVGIFTIIYRPANYYSRTGFVEQAYPISVRLAIPFTMLFSVFVVGAYRDVLRAKDILPAQPMA